MSDNKTVSRAEAILNPEDQDLLVSIGIGIRAHRIQSDLSVRALADRLVIGVQTVLRMEKGDARISMGYYLAACRVLGLQLIDPVLLSRQSEHLNLTRRRAGRRTDDEARFK
ncbi:helix-turn-helix transcriptional regulator [Solimonas sp. SE-A11]|uniref:helix-turn-helix domain-containing protein n=1 Tax=Solimonas sp. SE-A11 TaxID=3054954 RepID=UPI00259D15C8|nr:helix-turn-helix transcriptional regulator [Solimonas sp. SE-A11]MDM4772936.1 helix-turn-helix transcriptional regulator [Solimonas sp. SE-A11]